MHPNGLHLSSDDSYAPSAGSAINVREALWAVRRDWYLPAFGCLLGLMLAISYVLSTPTPYKSSTRILLDSSVKRYLQTNRIIDEPTFDQAEIGSQVYLLSSDSVVVPLVRSMNLTSDREFVGPPKADKAENPWSIGQLKKIVKQALGWNENVETDPDTALERMATQAVLKR